MKTGTGLALFTLLAFPCLAQAKAPEPPQPDDAKPNIGIDEKLGQSVPLDIKLIDENGDRVTLRDLVNKPTLLTLNYYRCAGLCTPLLNGVADMLQKIDLAPGKDFQVLTVSFDARDTAEMAAKKKENYVKQLGASFPASAWRFLTGDPISTKRLADSVGFRFAKHGEDYVHPAAIMVLSPTGVVSRYLYGTTYLPADVKMAVTEAAQGRSGPTIARLLRICYSYDPAGHTYSLNVTRIAAAVTLLLAIGFGVAITVTRRKGRNKPKASS
jgi:protein SCO1/2